MRSTKYKEIKCGICGDHIDVSACDLNYMIITNIDHRPSPIKKKRIYLCQQCTYGINKHIDEKIIKYEDIYQANELLNSRVG